MLEQKMNNSKLVKDWVEIISNLYKKNDELRTSEEIWISTLAYCSGMGEAIRRHHYEDLLEKAAHTFIWMCTFIAKSNNTKNLLFKINESFCDLVYLKFPKICGHCERRPCECDPYKMDKLTDKAAKYKQLYEKECRPVAGNLNYSIADWLTTFKDIYGGRIYLQTLENIGFHFLEESGEEAKAVRELVQMSGILKRGIKGIDEEYLNKITKIQDLVVEYESAMKPLEKDKNNKPIIRNYDPSPTMIKARIVKTKMDLIIEFADTFSWFCAVLLKLQMIGENLKKSYDIEAQLNQLYIPNGKPVCPHCKKEACVCIFYQNTE